MCYIINLLEQYKPNNPKGCLGCLNPIKEHYELLQQEKEWNYSRLFPMFGETCVNNIDIMVKYLRDSSC